MTFKTTAAVGAIAFTLGVAVGLRLDFNRAAAPDTAHEIVLNKGDTFTGAVARVHDGDTVTVNDGTRDYHVRIWGEDAYELKQTCDKAGQTVPCGRMAQQRLAALIGAAPLSCTVMGKEPYGRVLAQCFAGKTDVARTLIREGLALEFDSNGAYTADQAYADTNSTGMWDSDKPRQTPKEWRACHHVGRARTQPGQC